MQEHNSGKVCNRDAAETTRAPNKIEGYVSVDPNGLDLRDESGLPA